MSATRSRHRLALTAGRGNYKQVGDLYIRCVVYSFSVTTNARVSALSVSQETDAAHLPFDYVFITRT